VTAEAEAEAEGGNRLGPTQHHDVALSSSSFDAIAAAANGNTDDRKEEINEPWCEKICKWSRQVVDHFEFNWEVGSMAMSYLNRYLAVHTTNRCIFQLVAMITQHLAIKLYEPGKLCLLWSLVDLRRGLLPVKHTVTMRGSMLQLLGGCVHPPAPLAFCRDLMCLVPGDVELCRLHNATKLMRFMTKLSACGYWFVTRRPSNIALNSIMIAIELQGPRPVNPSQKVEFLALIVDGGTNIVSVEILACHKRLRQMHGTGGTTPRVSRAHLGQL
jgi:hypothetical protein